MDSLLGFLCAALAAAGNAVANVMQRKASLEESPDRPFSARLVLDLVRNPTWLIGFGGMVASFLLQAVALGLSELSAIEPVITLEVPLTLLVASRVFKVRIGRGEWSGILIMTGGMIALVAALNPQPGNSVGVSDKVYLQAGGSTALTILVLVLLGMRGRRAARTAFLGAAAGASFGLTATLIKETVTQLDQHGLVAMLSTWQTYAAATFGILGVLLMQAALHLGPLIAAQPGFTLMDPVVSILWGVLVFDEKTRTGAWLILAVAGTLAVGAGVVQLARSPLLGASAAAEDANAEPSVA